MVPLLVLLVGMLIYWALTATGDSDRKGPR
jgi:hypothetical protein